MLLIVSDDERSFPHYVKTKRQPNSHTPHYYMHVHQIVRIIYIQFINDMIHSKV